MSCKDCNNKDNTVKIILSIDGEEHVMTWCENCASKHGFHSPFEEKPFPLDNLIAAITQKNLPVKYDNIANPVCPNCGLTFHNLLEKGRIGCAVCYRAFGEPMETLLEKIHGSVSHTGRTIKVQPLKKHPANVDADGQPPRHNENKLKLELKNAIETENYEHAARLRDQLQALKAGA